VIRVPGRQLVVAVATLAGVYLAVFGPGVLTSIRALMGFALPSAPVAWPDRVAALEWDVFTTAVVVVVVMRWLPRRAPLVTDRMRTSPRIDRPIPGRIVGASAVYVALAAASGWAGDVVVSTWHLPHGAYTQTGSGTGSFVVTAASAGAAGFTEEMTLVALAAAVIEHAFSAGRCHRRWMLPATITVVIVLRLLLHLYYLWGSVFVLVWAPGAYVLYRWARSVWALVIGHWCYDSLVIAAQTFPRASRQIDTVLNAVAAVGVCVVIVAFGRMARSAERSASATQRP
jgi:hypothetical protein